MLLVVMLCLVHKIQDRLLVVFARRLNAMASKGVHAEVTLSEARQGFLGLYMFLYNLCQRLDAERPEQPAKEPT
jgi:hypothetical protein